jgi:hypothetical protein
MPQIFTEWQAPPVAARACPQSRAPPASPSRMGGATARRHPVRAAGANFGTGHVGAARPKGEKGQRANLSGCTPMWMARLTIAPAPTGPRHSLSGTQRVGC